MSAFIVRRETGPMVSLSKCCAIPSPEKAKIVRKVTTSSGEQVEKEEELEKAGKSLEEVTGLLEKMRVKEKEKVYEVYKEKKEKRGMVDAGRVDTKCFFP